MNFDFFCIFDLCEVWNRPKTQNSESPKLKKIAFLEIPDCSKLISRKILWTQEICHFYIVVLDQTVKRYYSFAFLELATLMCAIQIDSVITKAHNFSALEILCFFLQKMRSNWVGRTKLTFFFKLLRTFVGKCNTH